MRQTRESVSATVTSLHNERSVGCYIALDQPGEAQRRETNLGSPARLTVVGLQNLLVLPVQYYAMVCPRGFAHETRCGWRGGEGRRSRSISQSHSRRGTQLHEWNIHTTVAGLKLKMPRCARRLAKLIVLPTESLLSSIRKLSPFIHLCHARL